jgi:TolB-like protein
MKEFQIAAALAALLAGSAAQAKPTELEKETSLIASDLLKQAPIHGKKVALGDFTDSDGKLTGLSTLLAEDMELSLVAEARSSDFKMIDRRNFGELLKEWELSVNGSVDDENLVHAGRLLGADVLLVGKYTKIGKKIILRTTMVGAEKGEILAENSNEIALDGDLRDLSEKVVTPAPKKLVEASAPIKGPLKVELTTDKATYAVGDKMTVTVKVNQDCYLTVIDVGAGNKAVVLFPNMYAPNNAVKAGAAFTIPDPSAGFEFEVTAPAGLELIRAIASKEPSVDLKDAMTKPSADEPFGEVKQDLPVLTRDIHVKAKKAKPGEWSESVLKLTIR